MRIQEIMTDKVVAVGQDEPVAAAARLLRRWDLGALPVCDGAGRLRGFVTDRDIVLRCVAADEDPARMRVAEIMSRGILTASPTDSVARAAGLMARDQVRRLPVTEEGRLVGIVSLCDLARQQDCSAECAQAIQSISSNVKRPR